VNSLKTMLAILRLFTVVSLNILAEDANDIVRQTAQVHEVQVTSRKYEFSPNSLRVQKGEQVRLIIAALDHDHGFSLDESHINQKTKKKGKTATVGFIADKAGIFSFRRSNFCGLGDGGMKETLVVEE
jgi:cytochrome c oxidase subunit II